MRGGTEIERREEGKDGVTKKREGLMGSAKVGTGREKGETQA